MGNITSKKYNELVSAFKRNDDRVLKNLYQNVFPKVRSYVLKNNGDEEQAKDIFQEAFIACWQNIKDGKVQFKGNIEAYLFAITKNKWMDYLRSDKFKKTVNTNSVVQFSQNNNIESEYNDEEKNRYIMSNALKKLGETCQKLLSLYYFERLSMKQIASHFDIDGASARNKKYRCMQQLRSIALKIKNNGGV